ncbi:MAG: M20 family metallo-hydrolase [Gammaproteobacteria bacterium]|nr:M20 family metallo-hydrolase [Gammaproteobacteria bacterium]
MVSDHWASKRVDEARLWARHMEMAKIGATPKGGCNRAALTDLDIEARALFTGWARTLGFTCAIDPAGNLFARREGRDRDAPPVVSGSHLDTQPSGGRFDGIFGVLAALEALEAIETAGIDTARPLEAAVWTNEEGVRFQPGCLGSLAFTYPDRHEAVLDTVDADGVTLRQAVARYRERVPDLDRYPPHRPIHAYVEAHIEQGPILEQRGKTVGIVTGIQGSRRFEIEVHGEDAHSGTTPRARRKDALSAAVAMIGALEEMFHDDPEDITRFTVGRLVVSPNALAVVPGYVMFTVDFRQPHDDVLVRLGDRVEGICRANARGCDVVVTQTSHTTTVDFEGLVPETILEMAERLRVPHMHIFSGAGHDAKHIVNLCPTGMIFVPCEKGISHNEAENASPSDLAAGARVLADTLVKLANRES